jgi:hypothetical protein
MTEIVDPVSLGKNVAYIRKEYGDFENQTDLIHDSLLLMAINLTAKHQKMFGRCLTQKEIDDIVSLFREHLYNENMVTHE